VTARDELDADVIATVDVIDVTAHAIKVYGSREQAEEMLPEFARPMLAHDYRFEARRSNGASVTFHPGATAQHVAEYFKREGWAGNDEDGAVR
jgi:hypothetical protein